MLSADKKSALALLLGIVGLCAAPAVAQKPPRLLFLGISKDGRASVTAETAIQRRLGGLAVSVVRSKELVPCERADCLSTALALEHADLALTGRILKNEHACVATLWLAVSNEHEKSIEQDIACRFDGDASELAASLADGAAAMVDDYLRIREPDPEPISINFQPVKSNEKLSLSSAEQRQRWVWNWKRKSAVTMLGILFASSLAATCAFSVLDKHIACKSGEFCFNANNITNNYSMIRTNAYNFENEVIATGIASGLFAIGFSVSIFVR